MAGADNNTHRASETFFTISDSGYFLGTVALLNSLRLSGHTQDFVILDIGFTQRQAEILRPHCQLIGFDRSLAASPVYLKPFAQLTDPTGVVVIMDSDIVVTHSLEGILQAARSGQICAFAAGFPSRWFAEWERLFDLSAAPRRQTYVNAGFLAVSVDHWPDLIPLWWSACQQMWETPFIKGSHTDPRRFPDQDALNAILMSEVPRESLTLYSSGMGQGYKTDGMVMLHSRGPKPWDPRFLVATKKWRPAYVKVLRRCLVGPDVSVRVPPDELPAWLRPGLGGVALERVISGAQAMRYGTTHLRRALRSKPVGAAR